jgi:hypothetical protein
MLLQLASTQRQHYDERAAPHARHGGWSEPNGWPWLGLIAVIRGLFDGDKLFCFLGTTLAQHTRTIYVFLCYALVAVFLQR